MQKARPKSTHPTTVPIRIDEHEDTIQDVSRPGNLLSITNATQPRTATRLLSLSSLRRRSCGHPLPRPHWPGLAWQAVVSSFGRSKLKFPLGVYGRKSSSLLLLAITGSHRHIILARLSLAVVLTVVDKGSDKGEGNRQKGCG